MKAIWLVMGRVAFWLAWPALFAYLRVGSRTRVVVIKDGRVLVVKGWLGGGKWSLPGGGVHHGEHPELGAVRELKEETGLEVEVSDLTELGHGKQSAAGLSFRYSSYAVKIPSKQATKKQRFEIVDMAWIEPVQLNKRNSEQHVLDTLVVWKQKEGLLQ